MITKQGGDRQFTIPNISKKRAVGFVPKPAKLSNVSARQEVANDLLWRTHTDLNVIKFAKTGGVI